MKRLFLSTVLSLVSLLSSVEVGDTSILGQSQARVYICMSQSSYAYHSKRNCRALTRATHPIKQVSLEDAIRTYGRRACGYCYK